MVVALFAGIYAASAAYVQHREELLSEEMPRSWIQELRLPCVLGLSVVTYGRFLYMQVRLTTPGIASACFVLSVMNGVLRLLSSLAGDGALFFFRSAEHAWHVNEDA